MKKFLLVTLTLIFTCNINSFAKSKYSNKYIGYVFAECCNDIVSNYYFEGKTIAISTTYPNINFCDSLNFDYVQINYSNVNWFIKSLPKETRKQFKKGIEGILTWFSFVEDKIWLFFCKGVFTYKKNQITPVLVPEATIYEIKYNHDTKEWEILACGSRVSNKYWDPTHELFSKKRFLITPTFTF